MMLFLRGGFGQLLLCGKLFAHVLRQQQQPPEKSPV